MNRRTMRERSRGRDSFTAHKERDVMRASRRAAWMCGLLLGSVALAGCGSGGGDCAPACGEKAACSPLGPNLTALAALQAGAMVAPNALSPMPKWVRFRDLSLPLRLRADDGLEAALLQLGTELVGVIAGVTDECAASGEVDQLWCCDELVTLNGRQRDVERAPFRVDDAWILVEKPPRAQHFIGSLCRALPGAIEGLISPTTTRRRRRRATETSFGDQFGTGCRQTSSRRAG